MKDKKNIVYNFKVRDERTRDRIRRKIKTLSDISGIEVADYLEGLVDRELEKKNIVLENV